ncbi:hypothetical protein PLICRDRAFT_181194 [Plicaturopsis crispa FD-325 SS-3]|uniref:Uncharacterized protein n=1 Tax=Plicaturopsis crispa FD-325 SS-3 TaxID=944288 RepID=A0A0C9SPI2_PLICR|nr:hypothetical protein PLICRDRAFT_181194 [Plicaturopsis crispa FD-325 SS-3]
MGGGGPFFFALHLTDHQVRRQGTPARFTSPLTPHPTHLTSAHSRPAHWRPRLRAGHHLRLCLHRRPPHYPLPPPPRRALYDAPQRDDARRRDDAPWCEDGRCTPPSTIAVSSGSATRGQGQHTSAEEAASVRQLDDGAPTSALMQPDPRLYRVHQPRHTAMPASTRQCEHPPARCRRAASAHRVARPLAALFHGSSGCCRSAELDTGGAHVRASASRCVAQRASGSTWNVPHALAVVFIPPPPHSSPSALGCSPRLPNRDPTGYHSRSPWSQPGSTAIRVHPRARSPHLLRSAR